MQSNLDVVIAKLDSHSNSLSESHKKGILANECVLIVSKLSLALLERMRGSAGEELVDED